MEHPGQSLRNAVEKQSAVAITRDRCCGDQ